VRKIRKSGEAKGVKIQLLSPFLSVYLFYIARYGTRPSCMLGKSLPLRNTSSPTLFFEIGVFVCFLKPRELSRKPRGEV
jgi:hypothetical protein